MERNYILQDNYIYISHLDDEFKFWRLPVAPESFTDTMGSTFTPTNALGRTAPVYTYSNSGPRTVSVSFTVHRDMMDDVNMNNKSVDLQPGEDYIDNMLKALQSIALPRYNVGNKSIEPPLVALRISDELFVKGVLTSDISLTYTIPILPNGKYAQVSFTLTISEVDPYDATTVFTNGSFRGVVQTLKQGMNLA